MYVVYSTFSGNKTSKSSLVRRTNLKEKELKVDDSHLYAMQRTAQQEE
jgi:hypothetical protein